MMRIAIAAAAVFSALCLADRSHAVCGDVTGDGQITASDALAVLSSAVGQPADLTCDTGAGGPTRVRYHNQFNCTMGSSVSEASFNDITFTADGGEVSEFQDVALPEIGPVEIGICGNEFSFPGPFNLAPGRDVTFRMFLLNTDVHSATAALTFVDGGATP